MNTFSTGDMNNEVPRRYEVYYSADPADFRPSRLQAIPDLGKVDALEYFLLRPFRLAALPFAAVALSLAIYLSWPSETVSAGVHTHRLWIVPIVLLTSASGVLLLRVLVGDTYNRRRRRNYAINDIFRRTDSAIQWLPIGTMAIDRITESIAQTDHSFKPESQALALAMLLSPSRFNTRTGHTIDSEAQSLCHSVVRRIDYSGNALKCSPIPVHKEKKGGLSHRFSVKVNNQRASSLSSADGQALIVTLLTDMADDYLVFNSSPWSDLNWLTILTAVASESPIDRDSPIFRLTRYDEAEWTAEKTKLTFADFLEPISDRLRTGSGNDAAADSLVRLISDLAANNIIWTVLPESVRDWCHISTSYTSMLDIPSQTKYERFRTSFGLASRTVSLKLGMSRETQSYHLHVAVPEETYVYRSRVRLSEMNEECSAPDEIKSGRFATVLPGSRCNPAIRTSQAGANISHIYMRDAGSLVATDAAGSRRTPLLPSVQLEFREVPPGSLLWAIIVSFYVAGLSWAVSFYYTQVFPQNGTSMSTIWTTLLFGLPAILAGFLLSRFTKANLKQSSLVTLALLISSVFSAFLAMCVSVLLAYDKWSWSWDLRIAHFFDYSAERTITIMPWAIVVVLSTVNLTLGLLFAVVRRRRYTTRLYQMR